MRKLIITLIVLAALFVAADRVLVSAAEEVVARRAQVAADLNQEPKADIHGFPFLTQAVRGVYGQVDVSLPVVERDDLRVKNLVVHLHDVHAPLGPMLSRDSSATVRAESATASAVIPYEALSSHLPDGIRAHPAADGFRLTGTITRLGQKVSAHVTMNVSLRQGELVFSPSDVKVEGLPVTDALTRLFDFTVDVGSLPYGLRLTGVEATKNGIRLHAKRKDLVLRRASDGAFAPAGLPDVT